MKMWKEKGFGYTQELKQKVKRIEKSFFFLEK